MHPNDLKEFRDNVATPRMMELFEKTQIPEGTCYIDHLEISFLDGRSHGADSRIQASGMVYRDGKVEEYHYDECDVDLSEFYAEHKDCIFISDAPLRVGDELAEMDLNSVIRNIGQCERIFHQFKAPDDIKMEMVSIGYEKMNHLLSAQKGKAILLERDYKGEYERFALTPEEFNKAFRSFLAKGMPAPTTYGDSYTLQPLVHLWYCVAEVGGEKWNNFFTDMSWGMSESDIENGNLAYIREEFLLSLKVQVLETANAGKAEQPEFDDMHYPEETPEVEALRGEISNLRHELKGVYGYAHEEELAPSIERRLLIRECQLCAALKGVKIDEARLEQLVTSADAFYEQAESAGSLEGLLEQNGFFDEKMPLSERIKAASSRASGSSVGPDRTASTPDMEIF